VWGGTTPFSVVVCPELVLAKLIITFQYMQSLKALFYLPAGYRWKYFAPRVEDRQPYQADWLHTSVSSRGWGMFEAVDMCSALSILPIVDFNLGETVRPRTPFCFEFTSFDLPRQARDKHTKNSTTPIFSRRVKTWLI
jgi:hypothetical protein